MMIAPKPGVEPTPLESARHGFASVRCSGRTKLARSWVGGLHEDAVAGRRPPIASLRTMGRCGASYCAAERRIAKCLNQSRLESVFPLSFPSTSRLWSEEFPNPPNSAGADVGPYIEPNIEYQNWVRQTFSVTIPPTAAEIVRHPSRIDDDGSEDPFHQWVRDNTG
jgi:hypothetical protein